MKLPLRVKLAIQFSKLGNLGKALGLGIMKERDLIFWNRYYAETMAKQRSEFYLSQSRQPPPIGLTEEESSILNRTFSKPGRALILGCGDGREAIALAKMGWEVTGIDHSTKLLNSARKTALREGISFPTALKDLSEGLPLLEGKFNLITLLGQVYYLIPTEEKRVQLLKACERHLEPAGLILMNEPMVQKESENQPKLFKYIGLWTSIITRGFRYFEDGDTWTTQVEFHHKYADFIEFEEEVSKASLSISPHSSFVTLQSALLTPTLSC